MGKLSEKYKFLKNQDGEKLYIFKSGNFYMFLNDDAEYISKKYNLKITSFGNDIKCGFPVSAKNKYDQLLKNENILIVSEESISDKVDGIVKILNNIDLDKITPKDAINILYELKEACK